MKACMVALSVMVLAAAGSLLAAEDKDLLQGTWKLESLESGGQKIPLDQAGDATMSFKNDKYTFKFAESTEEGTIKLDAGKNPKTIDIHIEKGMDEGKDQVGIYKLDKDTVTFCLAKAGEKNRPTEFVSKEGSMDLMFTFKKQK